MTEGKAERPQVDGNQDCFDWIGKKGAIIADTYTLAIGSWCSALGGGWIVAPMVGEGALVTGVLSYLLTCGLITLRNDRRIKNEQIAENAYIQDPDFGYEVFGFNYKGRNRLVGSDRLELKSDDRLYLVSLSSVKFLNVSKPQPQELSLEVDLHNFLVGEIQQDLEEEDYDWVVLDTSWGFGWKGWQVYNRQRSIPVFQLFENHDVKVNRRNRPRIPETTFKILTPKEFAELRFDDDLADNFQKVRERLNDGQAEAYLSLYQSAATSLERKRIQKELERHLFKYIERFARGYFSDPEMIMTEEGGLRLRRKVYRFIGLSVQNTSLFVNIAIDGYHQSVPLSRFLDKDEAVSGIESPNEENGKSKTIHKAAAAYYIFDILQRLDLEELLRKRITGREELLEAISDWPQFPKKIAEVARGFHPFSYVDHLRQFRKRLIPFLAPSAAFLLGAASFLVWQDPADATETFIRQQKPGSFSSASPLLPKHQADWAVVEYGSKAADFIPAAGYYLEATSSHLDARGNWVAGGERQEQETYPRKPDFEIPHINLQKRILLDRFNPVEIKIPIKDGTSLAAVDVLDSKGGPVDFQIFRFDDGTREIVIDKKSGVLTEWVDISVFLKSSQGKEIKATGKMTPPINREAVEPSLKEEVSKIHQESKNSSDFKARLARRIRDAHYYILNPFKGSDTKDYNFPDKLLNRSFQALGCNCSSCNSELALAASLVEGEGSVVNLGFGYLLGLNTPASASRFSLDREAYHAVVLDQEGNIFDATPSELSDDLPTQQYINLRSQNPGYSKSEVSDEAKKKDFIFFTTLAIASSATLAAGYGLAHLLRKQRVLASAGHKSLSLFSEDDLNKAFALFGAVSWSEGGAAKYPVKEFDSKEEALSKIRENTHRSRVRRFLLTHPMPSGYSLRDRIKLLVLLESAVR